MSGKPRILIVDDTEINLTILEEFLQDEYEVQSAVSGQEALEKAAEFRPALCLLDVMMPGMDGFEVCKRLRTMPGGNTMKIVMLSAKSRLEDRMQGYEAGANDYVAKPFEEEELLAKVSVYLKLKTVEEVDKLKSDVLMLLNHETRTPLNGILPPVEILLTDDELEEDERREFLEMIQQSALSLNALLDKVLMLTALKAGTQRVKRIPHNVVDTLRDAVTKQPDGPTHPVITTTLAEEAPVLGDGILMGIVFDAIIDNAVRYGGDGVALDISLRAEDGSVTVDFKDNGPGIPRDLQPALFEAFTSHDVWHHSEGHGLSLAIAHSIVAEHNGSLSINSDGDKGTHVRVELPMYSNEETPQSLNSAQELATTDST